MNDLREIDQARRVGIAVSGGADSVFLLHALHTLNVAAAVIHINHGLRAAESDEDQRFVQDLAAALDLPFHVFRAENATGNLEQEARRVRYEFFAQCLSSGVCDVIATGHTLDDQAETVLTRFLRGSGTAGLSGIRPSTITRIIRPMLDIRRAEVRNSLSERGIPWREDSSNTDPGFLRNRIRLEIMPHLTDLNPSLPKVLAGTALWAQGEEEYWNQELERLSSTFLSVDREAILIEIGPFSNLPVAVKRRLLRRAIESVKGNLRGIDFHHVEAIIQLSSSADGSGRIQLPQLDVYRSFDWLRFAPPGYDSRLERNFQTELSVPGATALPDRLLTIDVELVTGMHVYNKQGGALDLKTCPGSLVLRNWRPGDRLNSEKIKTLFQEQRIPLWQRRSWPVIALGDSIVWTRRFGTARAFAATAESDQILLIREAEESKDGLQASVSLVARETQRVPVSGLRSAEAS